jgi:hypothetical protein
MKEWPHTTAELQGTLQDSLCLRTALCWCTPRHNTHLDTSQVHHAGTMQMQQPSSLPWHHATSQQSQFWQHPTP